MTRSPSPPPGRGLVTAPQCEAAYEGALVLDEGGNAADALVTAAFVQGVVDPHRCGVGGFGCSTLWFQTPAGAEATSIDFHGRAGSRAHESLWADRFESAAPDGFGYVVAGKVNDVGHASITVPGMVAGVSEIHRRFGTLPWATLVERAIPYAEEGFIVTRELAEFWVRPGLHGRVSTRDRLSHTADGRRICFHSDGSTYRAGETFRQLELARTLRRLAREGPESLSRGALAAQITDDWSRGGALLTPADLASYEPRVGSPLSGRFRAHEVLATPLPGGGVALLQALALASREDLERLGHNSPEYIDALARILQAVWHDRLEFQGDPRFGTPREDHFLEGSYLEKLAVRRDAAPPPRAPPAEGADTTQLTVVDGRGNVISFSHSLGYNSGVFSPGLGILFNNCMSGFDPRPGHRNSIAPGKARSTAVAETILVRDGVPVLALGSPGGARITAGLLQVILNVVVFGMNVAEAVVQPRFDGYGPGTLLLDARFPPPLSRAMAARGWDVVQSPKPFGVVGRVYAVELDSLPPRRPVAGVDPGAPGAAYRQR